MTDCTWMDLNEAMPLFGYTTMSGIKNALSQERFPVPTFKVGRKRVIDRKVVAAYFEKKSQDGLKQLANTLN